MCKRRGLCAKNAVFVGNPRVSWLRMGCKRDGRRAMRIFADETMRKAGNQEGVGCEDPPSREATEGRASSPQSGTAFLIANEELAFRQAFQASAFPQLRRSVHMLWQPPPRDALPVPARWAGSAYTGGSPLPLPRRRSDETPHFHVLAVALHKRAGNRPLWYRPSNRTRHRPRGRDGEPHPNALHRA